MTGDIFYVDFLENIVLVPSIFPISLYLFFIFFLFSFYFVYTFFQFFWGGLFPWGASFCVPSFCYAGHLGTLKTGQLGTLKTGLLGTLKTGQLVVRQPFILVPKYSQDFFLVPPSEKSLTLSGGSWVISPTQCSNDSYLSYLVLDLVER